MEFTFLGGEIGNEQNVNKLSRVIWQERLWRRGGAAVLDGTSLEGQGAHRGTHREADIGGEGVCVCVQGQVASIGWGEARAQVLGGCGCVTTWETGPDLFLRLGSDSREEVAAGAETEGGNPVGPGEPCQGALMVPRTRVAGAKGVRSHWTVGMF